MLSTIMPTWVIQTLDSASVLKKLISLPLYPPAGHADGTGSKLVPVIVTEVPTGASVGVKLVMVGACCVPMVTSNRALRVVASK
jgi:hypothetical protein